MKKQLWLLLALAISVMMWAAPAWAQDTDESYLPLCYYRENVNVAADETNFYWTDGEDIWQVARQDGDKTQIYTAHSIKYLSYANGSLFCIADGRLIQYDIATGKSKQLAEWADKPAVYQGYVYYLKNISAWHQQLCCKTAGGGTEYMLADYANCYWFSEGRVCWRQGVSGYMPGSDFIGSLPLGGNGGTPTKGYYTYAFAWADGWYYCLDEASVKEKNVVSNSFAAKQGKVYRWRWHNGQREYEKILLLPEGSCFDNVQVVDGTLYYTMRVYSEYTTGRMGVSTSSLYACDVAGDGLPRRLTDCKVGDFYVFGDQVVYKEAWWYGETRPTWQVLDLAK